MVVWLKPCESRSSPGALSRKPPAALRLGVCLCAEKTWAMAAVSGAPHPGRVRTMTARRWAFERYGDTGRHVTNGACPGRRHRSPRGGSTVVVAPAVRGTVARLSASNVRGQVPGRQRPARGERRPPDGHAWSGPPVALRAPQAPPGEQDPRTGGPTWRLRHRRWSADAEHACNTRARAGPR